MDHSENLGRLWALGEEQVFFVWAYMFLCFKRCHSFSVLIIIIYNNFNKSIKEPVRQTVYDQDWLGILQRQTFQELVHHFTSSIDTPLLHLTEAPPFKLSVYFGRGRTT